MIRMLIALLFMSSMASANNIIQSQDHASFETKEWIYKHRVEALGEESGIHNNWIWALIDGKIATASVNEGVRKCARHKANDCVKTLLMIDYTTQIEQELVVDMLIKHYMSTGMPFEAALLIIKHTTNLPIQ